MQKRRFMMLCLILASLSLLSLPSVEAATLVNFKITGNVDNGSCIGAAVVGTLTIKGVTDDGGTGQDFVFWEMLDGIGNTLDKKLISVPANNTNTDVAFVATVSGDAGQYFKPVSLPFSITVYEADNLGAVTTKLSGATLDTNFLPSCKGLSVGPPLDPDGDVDGDGVLNKNDNCVYVKNPGQEDGWGSSAGDLCDGGNIYDTGRGVKAFQQKNGDIHVHGACFLRGSRTECPLVAIIKPKNLNPNLSPQHFSTGAATGWYVEVYYLGAEGSNQVYQVNTYGGGLQDDHLEIVVALDGKAFWRSR